MDLSFILIPTFPKIPDIVTAQKYYSCPKYTVYQLKLSKAELAKVLSCVFCFKFNNREKQQKTSISLKLYSLVVHLISGNLNGGGYRPL